MTLSLAPTSGASSSAIEALTEAYGDLPSSYIAFLGAYDGVVPPENVLRGSKGLIGIRSFISAADILHVARRVEGLPDELMPIADDDSGNYICMDPEDHRIYFWDHEIDNLDLISEDFSVLLSKLDQYKGNDAVKPDFGEVWIKPGFKPDFGDS